MPRRNPYHAGNSGQQLYTLEPVEGDQHQTADASGSSVVARRPRYGFPGDIMAPSEATRYDAAMKPVLNYDEEE